MNNIDTIARTSYGMKVPSADSIDFISVDSHVTASRRKSKYRSLAGYIKDIFSVKDAQAGRN